MFIYYFYDPIWPLHEETTMRFICGHIVEALPGKTKVNVCLR